MAVIQVIIRKFPEAEWFFENTNSPPIIKLINEYFPRIDKNYSNYINSNIIGALKSSISARNSTVHNAQGPIAEISLNKKLLNIKELLWYCDYLCGHKWALGHMAVKD